MNFKMPKIPSLPKSIQTSQNAVQNAIQDEIFSAVSNSIPDLVSDISPDIIANALPDIEEIKKIIFDKIFEEYNLTENEVYIFLALLIVLIVVTPCVLATAYSEYLNIKLFYIYVIMVVIAGASLLSYKLLEEDKRNNFLIFNGIISGLITLNAVYFAITNPD